MTRRPLAHCIANGHPGRIALESELAVNVIVSAVLGVALFAAAASSFAATAPAVQAPAAVPDAGAALLVANARDPGVTTLPSGLQYRVLRAGPAGPSPKEGDVIKVHYEGKLVNGEVFDSSFERDRPALMPLGNLIPAWMEALPLMRVGDEWTLYAPPALGYGDEGAGPIPPGSILIFRLHFLGMLSAD
jgi:FKBP-type peptidyl-prolyl cis-trans isomerase FklB